MAEILKRFRSYNRISNVRSLVTEMEPEMLISYYKEPESWTLLDTHRSKIQASEMRFLRRVEKVTKRDRIRNQVIGEQLQVESLQERIERTS
jgi:hypothetical protein